MNKKLIRKMQTAAGGPLRIKFTPEQISYFESRGLPLGMNNSKNYREEGVLALLYQELEKQRKEEKIASRMEMKPILKKKASKLGEKDLYKLQVNPSAGFVSPVDPVAEFFMYGNPTLKGVGALAKTGLLGAAKYAPATQLRNYGRLYFVGNAFKNSFNGTIPALTSQATSLLYLPAKLNETGLTSLKFFERKPTAKWSNGRTAPKITAENAASITPEQWTAAQDAAIARGNMTEAQRLRDLHADVKGYNSSLPLYHGSPEKNITAFDPNAKAGTLEGSGGTTFFTPNFEAADTYAKGKGVLEMTHDPGKVYKVYSAHKNPKIIDYDGASYLGTGTKLTMNAGDGIMRRILNPKGGGHFLDDYTVYTYDKLPIEGLEYPRYYAPPRNKHIVWEKEKVAGSTSEEAAKAMSEGYDVAILKNVDEGVGPNSAKIGPIDDYAIRNPRLIKSADAVTYDNNGARIPLGERDNFNINDIRYGLLPFGIIGAGAYLQPRTLWRKQGGKMNILEFLKNGSGIHIKKKNRGKFTSYCGGKVTDECILKGKNSSNPAIRKRATFAANARKWKHLQGGTIVNGLMDIYRSIKQNQAIDASMDAMRLQVELNKLKLFYNEYKKLLGLQTDRSDIVNANKAYNEAKNIDYSDIEQLLLDLKQSLLSLKQENISNLIGSIANVGSYIADKAFAKKALNKNGTPSSTPKGMLNTDPKTFFNYESNI